ncbi:MAG: phosphatase PAP2 family protein [Steroidobacteraceae bacterium]|nr:phosphatase PAP2 family protein [Steroidobacteraceae bacterium]
MMSRTQRLIAGFAVGAVIAALAIGWPRQPTFQYLDGQTAEFVAQLATPPAPESPQTRRELDELLELQRKRTPADVEAARADRKTEATRFYAAMGLQESADLPRVERLIGRAEDDVRLYIRAAKQTFRRLRPVEIEPRIRPCVGGVREDLSYPSGHSAYGYATAYLLIELAPERRDALLARADEFARQRMVCGVHFRSDIDTGRHGAQWLVARMPASQRYADDVAAAAMELRDALAARPK